MADDENEYQKAIWKAFEELQAIQKQERELTIRKAHLKQTVDALFPIAYPNAEQQDINELTLADAIRLVMNSGGRPMTAKEVRSRLEDIGFDLTKFANPLASIWTAAKRMLDAEELVRVEDEDIKKLKAGPELKPVPEIGRDSVAALEAIAVGSKSRM